MNKEKRYYNLNENINRTANKNNKLLNEIKEDIESDPVLDMFSKDKGIENIIKFFVTAIIVIVVTFLISYDSNSNSLLKDKLFSILGNSFYWILVGYSYIGVSFIVKLIKVRSCKNGKNKKRKEI